MHRRSQACRVNAKADSGLLGTTIGRRTMLMGRLTFVILMGSLFAAPAVAESRAAAYLAKQEINDGCDGRQGRIDPAGLIERDLDGDGMPDLIISHEAIRCAGKMSRSSHCGMQVCSVLFYLRRGSLLQKAHDMLGANVKVGRERIPKVHMDAHGGGGGYVRWNGKSFD